MEPYHVGELLIDLPVKGIVTKDELRQQNNCNVEMMTNPCEQPKCP